MNTADLDTDTWFVRTYGSGTMIVQRLRREPYYYIYGPANDDYGRYMRDRHKVCQDLCDYLNGANRPAWLDDLRRVSETAAEDADGTSITAVGPWVDCDPPNCHWVFDESPGMVDARARFMDRLFLTHLSKGPS